MKRLFTALVVAAFGVALAVPAALAQSSGNFTYGTTGATMGCVLENNGTLSGGVTTTNNCGLSTGAGTFSCLTNSDCTAILGSNSGATCSAASSCASNSDCTATGSTCVSGTCTQVCQEPNPGTSGCVGSLKAAIKTSSGNGNVFVVRPSAVIGLLTDVTISSKQAASIASSSAGAGIDFTVNVTPAGSQLPPAEVPNFPVTYAARFIQISTNLFQAISTQCQAITNGCFLTFAESTDSAHSFDWIVGSPAAGTGGSTLSSGTYDVEVDWKASPVFGVSGIAEAAACVGPVNLTVEQNKIFNFNSVNSF